MGHSSVVINRKPPRPALIVERSLTDFHLQGELGSNHTGDGDTLDITDVISLSVWTEMPTSNIYGQQILFAYRPTAGGFGNHFEMRTEFNGTTGPPDHIVVAMNDASSVERQRNQWNNVLTPGTNTWHHIVYTWDGNTDGSTLYVDGIEVGVSSVFTNLDGSTITDTARNILIGSNLTGLNSTWTGPVYSAALYNSVLSSSEVSYLYNSGNPTTVDPETNFGSYQSANSMQHYYRLGIGTTDDDFGLDRGVGSNAINLGNNNITEGFLTEETPVSTGRYWGFRSSNISMLQKDSLALGVSDQHTLMMWIRRKGTFYSRGIWDSAEVDSVSNRRLLLHNDSNEIQYELRGPIGSSSASLVLSYRIEDLPNSGTTAEWEQFVFVYDGTNAGDNDLFIYRNGVELTTGAGSGIGDPYLIKTNDGSPNQTDTSVSTALGGRVGAGLGSMWDGEFHHAAIWDDVLTQNEITALYAGGAPANLDLGSDFGNYASSANLVHWWTWEDEGDRGADYGSGSMNLLDDANASPGFSDNGNQIWWSYAEYPGSAGDSTT